MTKIAFLGLGAMGIRMASRLLQAGHHVTVWNRTMSKAEALERLGATVASSPVGAATGADVVISMVTDDVSAQAVWLDERVGAVNGLEPSAVAIECSTVSPTWVRDLGKAVRARNASLLDAPVAGSRPQAESGQLVFMIGGEAQVLEQIRPILAPMAASILHVGELGKGTILKLAVNALFATQLESVAELLGFLTKSGFERNEAAQLLAQFPIVAAPIAGVARMMAAQNFGPMFTIDLISKDLGYVLDSARDRGADLPGALSAHATFQLAQAKGLGASNISGLAQLFL